MPDRPPIGSAALDEAALLMPGLVHEMRQPVMGIKAGLQLLASVLRERLTGLDDWQLVLSQVARLEEIFDAYQQFMEEAPPDARPFEAAPVVLRAVDLLRFRTKKLGARFAVVTPHDLPAALGTPSALLHAVTNLVMNALDAVDGAAGRDHRGHAGVIALARKAPEAQPGDGRRLQHREPVVYSHDAHCSLSVRNEG